MGQGLGEGMLGGGGGCRACFQSRPLSVGGGGRGSKRSAPLFSGPQGEPAHGLHPCFVVAEIWADRASAQGGGVGSRPVLKLGVAQQAGDEFVAKQTFFSL